MRLVYRDIRMVVNYKMNNFGEGVRIKGSIESPLTRWGAIILSGQAQ